MLAACLTCFMFNDPTLHSSYNKVILSRVLSRYMNLAHALLWCVSAQAIQYPDHPQYVSRRNRRKHCKVTVFDQFLDPLPGSPRRPLPSHCSSATYYTPCLILHGQFYQPISQEVFQSTIYTDLAHISQHPKCKPL